MMVRSKLRGAFNPVLIVMLMFFIEVFCWGTCNAISMAADGDLTCNIIGSGNDSVLGQFMGTSLSEVNVTDDFASMNITFGQNSTWYNNLVNSTVETGVTTDSNIFISGLNFVWDGLIGLFNILLSPFSIGLVLSSVGTPAIIVVLFVGLFAIPLVFLVFSLFTGRP